MNICFRHIWYFRSRLLDLCREWVASSAICASFSKPFVEPKGFSGIWDCSDEPTTAVCKDLNIYKACCSCRWSKRFQRNLRMLWCTELSVSLMQEQQAWFSKPAVLSFEPKCFNEIWECCSHIQSKESLCHLSSL